MRVLCRVQYGTGLYHLFQLPRWEFCAKKINKLDYGFADIFPH
jgi:hypothetical protein